MDALSIFLVVFIAILLLGWAVHEAAKRYDGEVERRVFSALQPEPSKRFIIAMAQAHDLEDETRAVELWQRHPELYWQLLVGTMRRAHEHNRRWIGKRIDPYLLVSWQRFLNRTYDDSRSDYVFSLQDEDEVV